MRCYFDQELLFKIKWTKNNRKILIKMSAVLLVTHWVRVELIVQIYLSLYFPFKIFMMILHFRKQIFNEKQREKDLKWTSLTTFILWFSWCTHLCS
jgi:hypothetical protein